MDWGAFGKNLLQVAPLILSVVPGIPPIIIPVAIHAIQVAEQSGKPGADKKAIALNMVHDGIEVHNAINKEHPIDSSTVVDAVGNGIDATITTIKAVEKAKAGLPTVQ